MNQTDTCRLGAFLSAGIDGEKAEALVNFVRTIEENSDAAQQVRQKQATIARLADNGMDGYVAFTALMCHPSDHEPYGAIGSEYLNEKEAHALGNDA